MKRLAIALAMAAAIYAATVGLGSALYAAGIMPTGAAHNDCPNYREVLAEEQGIGERDVEQEDIKQATITCLADHTLEEDDVFRTKFLLWGIWPAVIVAVFFLAWPLWTGILLRQEEHEPEEEDQPARHDAGAAST